MGNAAACSILECCSIDLVIYIIDSIYNNAAFLYRELPVLSFEQLGSSGGTDVEVGPEREGQPITIAIKIADCLLIGSCGMNVNLQ